MTEAHLGPKGLVITNTQPYSYWTNFDGADASLSMRLPC